MNGVSHTKCSWTAMFPVRCYTCNAVIAQLHPTYTDMLESGMSSKDALQRMNVARMCCRRMFLSHVDLFSNQIHYPNKDIVLDKGGTMLYRYSHSSHDVPCS